MSLSSSDVLFVGKGPGVVSWYRTGSVAFYLGCDWIGIGGRPPKLWLDTALKRGGPVMPKFDDYKIVILQQVAGREWLNEILRLKRKGIAVFYEIDDYIHAVRKMKHHRSRHAFDKKALAEYELCMRVCDGLIVSTEYLAERYSKFNRRIFLCRNSIEAIRYKHFEIPDRNTINIGWAGGEGHLDAVKAWLPAIDRILDENDGVRFVSIGLPVADLLKRKEAISLPFTSIENFPAAMCNFDLAIAPAERNAFYAGKSDLRFLECGGIGVPLVADPFVYDDINDGVTGVLAGGPDTAYECLTEMVLDGEYRRRLGRNARDYVLNHRCIEKGVEAWERIFQAVARGEL